MTANATFQRCDSTLHRTAATTLTAGLLKQLEDGRAGALNGLQSVASGYPAEYSVEGIFDVVSASATTFAAGAEVFWDYSAQAAVPASASLNGAEDFYLGTADKAKASGELVVSVDLNNGWKRFRPFVREFDFEDGADVTTAVTLVPACMNPTGLQIVSIFGIVTEQFGGGTQDQGILTVKDTAGTPNTLCTLTPSDAGADAVNDVVQGAGAANAILSATGVAVKNVAANLGITGTITQVTSGSSVAGKMKVYIMALPLA